jgi:iron complex outermembrane receptor protein
MTTSIKRRSAYIFRTKSSCTDDWIFQLGECYDWIDIETVINLQTGTRTTQDVAEFTGRAGVMYFSDIGLPYFSYAESFPPVARTGRDGAPFEPETGR